MLHINISFSQDNSGKVLFFIYGEAIVESPQFQTGSCATNR